MSSSSSSSVVPSLDSLESETRIAIVNSDKCKPKKCRQECKRVCPVVKLGKLCVVVEPTSTASVISESLCIGCGMCAQKCPFDAIQIVKLPKSLTKDTTHRYGPNSFKLHRLPQPRLGQVLGLVGTNGIGKSTALQILAGKLKPNLGRFETPPQWTDIITNFRGSELQNYFTRLIQDSLKPVVKPQYIEQVQRALTGTVNELLEKYDARGVREEMNEMLELQYVIDRDLDQTSGGELQRICIALTCVQQADIYMFDEPSSFLDIRQRLLAAKAIRTLCSQDKYIICVEHDLSVLDFLSDFVCCLYGQPGAYGVVTAPFSVREGINIFLAGFIPTENMRFRKMELNFKIAENVQQQDVERHRTGRKYEDMQKQNGSFKLSVKAGDFSDSEIIVMLGQNGSGKTTFIRMLVDYFKTSSDGLTVSHKPQSVSPKFEGTVRQLFHNKIPHAYMNALFVSDVMKPMLMEQLMDRPVKELSGGEIQRTAIVLTLGKPADVYLIDEPSAYLDSEQRIVAAKVIKRFIINSRKTAFIVEHDFIMATYLADRVIVYSGTPAVECTASTPMSLLTGMNQFLKDLNITFRRDPTNYRPRINKLNSVKDREQKSAGTYFYIANNSADEIGAGMSKADKKRAHKMADAQAKEMIRETKKLLDAERKENEALAVQDKEDAVDEKDQD